MNTTELVALARTNMDDVVEPYFLSDAQITEALSDAQVDFAEYTLSVVDASSLSVAVTTGDPWVDLPANVLEVRTLYDASTGNQVRPVLMQELDNGFFTVGGTQNSANFSNWRALTGTPKFAVQDMDPGKLRLVPSPTADATLQLEAFVRPAILSLDEGSPVDPVIPQQYQRDLVSGALAYLYSIQDNEIYDPNLAQYWRGLWADTLNSAMVALRSSYRQYHRKFPLPRTFQYRETPPAGIGTGQPPKRSRPEAVEPNKQS